MIDYERFVAISPNDRNNPLKKESLDTFIPKVKSFLPNMPDDVIDQWVYEAFSSFCNDEKWNIEYDRLHFQKNHMDIKDILKIRDASQFYEMGIGYQIIDGSLESPLIQFMKKHGTWPRPIIVLDTEKSVTDTKFKYLYPYQLLEGHLRLVYLRRMLDAGIYTNKVHNVWIAVRE